MRRNSIYFLLVTGLSFSMTLFASAQEKPAEQPKLMAEVPPIAPTSGFRAEFLEEIAYYEQRYTRLAEAMPAQKYTWRPGEGVRSTGEVYAHIVVANYLVGRALTGPFKPGVTYGVDSQTLVKTTMALSGDKPKLLQALKNSFASLRNGTMYCT